MPARTAPDLSGRPPGALQYQFDTRPSWTEFLWVFFGSFYGLQTLVAGALDGK